MQKQLKKLLSKALALGRHLDNEGGLLDFEAVISEISGFNEPEVIRPLLLLIPDSGTSNDAAFSIVHYVETFDDRTYISSILETLDVFYKKSPYWCCVVMLRIINNSSSFEELNSQIETSASLSRKVFATVCTGIVQRFPSSAGKISTLNIFC